MPVGQGVIHADHVHRRPRELVAQVRFEPALPIRVPDRDGGGGEHQLARYEEVVGDRIRGQVRHIYALGDLVGSRGPDGHDWPIPYLVPFADVELRWSGQWALNAWPNLLATGLAMLAIAWLGARRGRTPMEIISPRLDAVVVARLRTWF